MRSRGGWQRELWPLLLFSRGRRALCFVVHESLIYTAPPIPDREIDGINSRIEERKKEVKYASVDEVRSEFNGLLDLLRSDAEPAGVVFG